MSKYERNRQKRMESKKNSFLKKWGRPLSPLPIWKRRLDKKIKVRDDKNYLLINKINRIHVKLIV